MPSTIKKIAGRTFLGVAVLLIGSWIAFAPANAHAAFQEVSHSDWSIVSGDWSTTVQVDDLGPFYSGNQWAHKSFCTTTSYSGTCLSGSGANGGIPAGGSFSVGFSTTTNIASGLYYYTFAPYKPDNSFSCTAKDCYYFSYEWDNDTKTITTPILVPNPGFNAVTNTRFLDVDFNGTSTVEIDVSYFLDEEEIDSTISQYNPTLVRFNTALRPGTDFSRQAESISNTVFGTSTVSTSFTGLADGVYDLSIDFANGGTAFGSPQPFPFSYVYTSFTIAGGVLTATSSLEFYDYANINNETTYKPCSITEIGGCIINAFVFLFVPSTDSINSFFELNETLSTKFPFAYLYDFQSSITSLFNPSPTASSTISYDFAGLGELSLISQAQLEAVPYASFIKVTLGYLMWIAFASLMYRRTLKIFNQNPV